MNTLKMALILALFAHISSCSTAGPFVTNISSDRDGELSVDKCMVEMNSFTGNITTKECARSTLRTGK